MPPISMKAMMTHWTIGSNAPTLSFRVEKPPVASVVSAWQIASKAGTSRSRSSPTRIAVSTVPTITVSRAVSLILGSVFSGVGPGASAVSTSTAHWRRPSSQTKMMTIPSPPSHWVRALQSSRERGSHSTSGKMVAPVVEKPDADSNRPFTTKPGPNSAMYGRAPNTVARHHASTTKR